MPKRVKSWTEFDILRAIVILAIIIYILGIVPQFTEGVKALFANPLMKIVFLALIVFAGYLDSTIGTLLSVAFLVSYLSTPEYKGSPVYDVLSDVRSGASHVVGGVGSGTNRLIGGVGSGASQVVGGVGTGASRLIGGVQSGAQQLTSGVGSGAQQLLGGAQKLVGGVEGGAQQVLGGVGSGVQQLLGGAQKLVGGVEGGVHQVLGGVGSGAQQLTTGLASGAQSVIGGVGGGVQHIASGLSGGSQQLIGGAENLENPPMSVSQAYQQQMESETDNTGCNVQPAMVTGCDPIVGYNAPYNCGCSGACGGNCKGLDPACLCKGVQVWKDELNAQGLHHPRGYAGGQVGSTY
jgi:hypothetical protein